MMCALRWIGSEVREPPNFYGQNNLEECLTKFELEVLENHRLLVLDMALKATPARWWVLTKRISITGINARGYYALDLAHNRRISI
jgi:hypothetical protein